MRPERGDGRQQTLIRSLLAGMLLLPALSACGHATGAGDRDPVVTNAGDIASNQAVANQVEASGNDQPPRLVAGSNGSAGR